MKPPRLPLLPAAWLLAGLTPAGAQVRLTELLAVNSGGLRDQAGAPQPWIEVWNAGQVSPVSLANYRLIHGGVTWLFPSVRIMPDERMVVFASGQDKKEVISPLHTGFRLAAEGGTLVLQNASGSMISTLPYPALPPDSSWGRDEWDSAAIPQQTGSYTIPSPGERNNFEGPGVAGDVVFDTPSRAFSVPLTVSLSAVVPDPSAEIRFTTNRTVPTAASPLYTGPISVGTTQMIRARVFKAGLLPGPTRTAAWLALHSTTRDFSSTLPIAVITPFSTTSPPDDGDQISWLWLWEPGADGRARMADPPTLTSRIVMDKRGSSTLGNPKFNLNLETRNDYDDDGRDVPLLGMAAHSDWVFHAPYDYDRSLLHNPLMYTLSRSIGRYAPDSRMAEVFIDVTGGSLNFTGTSSSTSDYYGVYNVMEKIRRDGKRVDIQKLGPYDNSPEAKTGGYIWKVDRQDPQDTGFTAGGQLLAYYYPKERELKSPQRAPQEQYLTDYLNSFSAALHSADWKNPETGYAAWLDVPSAIDNHLLNLWPYNVDAFRLSTFWHKNAGGKIVAGPIWDFDRSLSSTDGRDADPSAWGNGNWPEGGFFAAHWWQRLFEDIDFYQKYIDRWQALRRTRFSPASVNALIDSLNQAVSPEAITRDTARWQRGRRAWTSPFTGTVHPASQAAEVQRLKDYLQQRANYFDSQWVGPVTASPPGGFVPADTAVTLAGPVGVPVYYTLNGPDPRPSGGGPPIAEAQLWNGTPVSVPPGTRVLARAYKAGHTAVSGGRLNPPLVSNWGGLTDPQYTSSAPAGTGNTAITEIHFNPADPTEAEITANPAWTNNSFEFLELRNTGSHPIDLRSARFTTGVTYIFAPGIPELEPGAHLIVSSDPAAFTARYGAAKAPVYGPWSGNLSNSGETLTLNGPDGSLIQTITYDDKWFASADKGGFSLVVHDPAAQTEVFGSPANWRASAVPGGSPGHHDSASLPPAKPSGEMISCVYQQATRSLLLTWHAMAGARYAIWVSEDLISWSIAARGLTANGSTGVFEYTPPAGVLKQFFKVQLEL
ncbi:MAG: CotH kinase family protein [Verrucomicrobiota bacterium]